MKLNRKGMCCENLHGLEVSYYCNNCGTVVVDRDAGKHTIHVIDSARAKKALACVEELVGLCNWPAKGNIYRIFKKYGFMRKRLLDMEDSPVLDDMSAQDRYAEKYGVIK